MDGASQLQPVMKSGFYNQNSQFQQSALQQNTLSLIQQAIRDSPLPSDGLFRVLDCASSQGRNSSIAARNIIHTLQERLHQEECKKKLAVVFTHEDLPSNDFSTLIQTINDPIDGYMHLSSTEGSNCANGAAIDKQGLQIYSNFVGRSMYQRLVPDQTLHLVLAFTCLHW
jgi:hypothetical protein